MATLAGNLSFGGIDVLRPGVSRGSVLSKVNPNARAPEDEAPDKPAVHLDGNPVMTLVAMVAIIVVMSWLARQKGGEVFGINVFTFAFFIIVTVTGIALLKIAVAQFPIPGLTQVLAIV